MLDKTANTIYDYTKPTQSIYNVVRPSTSFSEQLASAALLANATADASNRKPPIPNIGVIAPRYGYPSEPATIYDIISSDPYPAKFGDWSGSVGGYAGSAFPNVAGQL